MSGHKLKETHLLASVHGQAGAGHAKLEEEHDEQNDHVLERSRVKVN